jgi:hypothetical protein
MSTINVDNVLPQSGTTVNVNGVITKKETNKPLILWNGISQTSTGFGTTIVGEEAMIANTGNNNTALGFGTLRTNSSGADNTSVGHQALYENTTGAGNVAIGKDAMFGSLSGVSNTALGTQSLYVCKGSYNTALGNSAGFLLTTGQNNTLVGMQAGNTITTGNGNIVIGHDAQPASATTNNSITLGNSLISVLRCNVTSITSLSDARDKTNVEDSTYGLSLVNSLKPVTFEWDTRDGAKKGIKDLGFIAQDLKELDDEYLGLVYDENPEKLEASYGKLIPVLVKAIQELTAKVEALEAK